MKKIFLLITLLSLSTFVSAEFFSDDKVKSENSILQQKYSKTEFHGLKAGMTKAEVKEYLQFDKYIVNFNADYSYLKVTEGELYSSIKQIYLEEIDHQDFSNKQFEKILMSFTDDGVLWKIQINFSVPSDTLNEIALRSVISDNFPDATIEESKGVTGGKYSRPYHTIHVIMADREISESVILKYENYYKKQM